MIGAQVNPSATVNSSASASTGAIAAKARAVPLGAGSSSPGELPSSVAAVPDPEGPPEHAPRVPARAIARAPVPPPMAARRVSAEEAMSRKVGLSLWLHGPKAHWLAHFRAQVTAERLPRTASFMSRGRSIRVIGDSFAVGTRPAAQRSGALTTVRQEDEAISSSRETEDELWRPPGPHHRRSSPPEPAPPQIWRMRELNGHGAFNSRIRQESGGTGPAGPGSGAARLRSGPAQERAGSEPGRGHEALGLDQHHRHGRFDRDPLGGRAQQDLPDRGTPADPEHDHEHVVVLDRVEDVVGRIVAFGD